ncbi:XRE family transcriptional regulator [Klebsiella spallanzanii]|uniref:XRE family transcriptional regulator n=1 Tax=Klebsiella spallanzanii TaxID=2587528 RepID=UPI001156E592|nr:helix-turn-helix transcriptional regulator [Klebsiella spallanzanii]VUS85443.1 HTH-type transcriptional regulator PrtR [Klebsiella spallanzanii]
MASNHPCKESQLGCEGFHSRLRIILDKFRSVNAFANVAGISPSGLNRLLDGGYPTLPILVALAKAGDVSVEWLSTGGEQVSASLPTKMDSTSLTVTDVKGNEVDLDEFVFVPRYNIAAAAGFGAWNDDETPMFTVSFRRYWVTNHLKADPSKLSVISVYGDSMEGILNDKDIILINHDDREPREGIYVLRIDGQLIVKRVQRLPGSILRITSTNPAYEPFSVDMNNVLGDFAVVGKVVWYGRVV